MVFLSHYYYYLQTICLWYFQMTNKHKHKHCKSRTVLRVVQLCHLTHHMTTYSDSWWSFLVIWSLVFFNKSSALHRFSRSSSISCLSKKHNIDIKFRIKNLFDPASSLELDCWQVILNISKTHSWNNSCLFIFVYMELS